MIYVPSTLVSITGDLPVALEDFKVFLRQDNDDEDAMLSVLLEAALLQAQDYVQIALATQTRKVSLLYPVVGGVALDFGPVLDIVSVTYRDSDGDTQTLDPSRYVLVGDNVFPAADTEGWPISDNSYGASITITYSAGSTGTSSPVTPLSGQLKSAIWLFGQVLYDRNEKVSPMLDAAAKRLLDTVREGQGI
jgi:uncharacterized phiE125 gp8 family phage protein